MQLSRSRLPKSDCILQLRGSSSVQPSKSPNPSISHQFNYYSSAPNAGFPVFSPNAGIVILELQMLDFLSSAQLLDYFFRNGSSRAMHQLIAMHWRSVYILAMVSAPLISAGLLLFIIYMFGICDSIVWDHKSISWEALSGDMRTGQWICFDEDSRGFYTFLFNTNGHKVSRSLIGLNIWHCCHAGITFL